MCASYISSYIYVCIYLFMYSINGQRRAHRPVPCQLLLRYITSLFKYDYSYVCVCEVDNPQMYVNICKQECIYANKHVNID